MTGDTSIEASEEQAEDGSIERETLEDALDTYGIDAQVEQTEEELAELLVALKGDNVADVIEELADVRIMVEQLSLWFGEDHVETVVDEKMERLERRIEDARADQEGDADA